MSPEAGAKCAFATPSPIATRRVIPSTRCMTRVAVPVTASYNCTPSPITRAFVAAAASALVVSSALSPAFGIVSAPPCIKGEGPGCDTSAADSPLIQELLEKSRANREKHDKETLEKYWKRGYGDYFSYGYNKELKQGEDGKWSLQDPDDLFTAIQRRITALAKSKDK